MINNFAQDFMQTDLLLTDEEISVRDSVRDFVAKEISPLMQKCNREESFPRELTKRFAEMGLFGTNLKGYDCPGLGDVAYGLAMQELERADSGIRSFCSVQGALAMYSIYAFGNEEQKKKYLPEMAKGNIIGCFGLTESDSGSNPGGMKTHAKKTTGGYTISGSKTWITNGNIAHLAIVWAKCENEIKGFIVDTKAKGFGAKVMEGKFSLRVSVTSELFFDDLFVPDENVLPLAKSLKAPLSCLTQARYGIAWGVIGAAEACFHTSLDYAKTRIIFNKPLSAYQLAQAKLVKMALEINKAKLLAIQMGRLKEAQKLDFSHVSMAKLNNCKIALEIARDARDILGANGIIDEYPVIRHMMNLETVNTYEGTEDIHRLIVGEKITETSAIK